MSRLRFLLVLPALALALPAAAEEIVHFTSGRTMPVASHKVVDGMVHVDLGENRTLAFPESMVDSIETAGENVMLKQSAKPFGKRRVPNPNGSYPQTGATERINREEIPTITETSSKIEIDPKTGVASYRPLGNSEATNKRKLQVSGNMRALRGTVERGGNGKYAGTTPVGNRHVIGGIAPRRSNTSMNPKRPPLVGIEMATPGSRNKASGNDTAPRGDQAESGANPGRTDDGTGDN